METLSSEQEYDLGHESDFELLEEAEGKESANWTKEKLSRQETFPPSRPQLSSSSEGVPLLQRSALGFP